MLTPWNAQDFILQRHQHPLKITVLPLTLPGDVTLTRRKPERQTDIQFVRSFSTTDSVRLSMSLGCMLLDCSIRSLVSTSRMLVRYTSLVCSAMVRKEANRHLFENRALVTITRAQRPSGGLCGWPHGRGVFISEHTTPTLILFWTHTYTHTRKWNKSVRDKHCMISLTWGVWKRKTKRTKLAEKRSDLWLAEAAGGGRENWRKVVKGTNLCYKRNTCWDVRSSVVTCSVVYFKVT